MININELNRRRRQKKQRDKEIFTRVLKRCHIRIKMSANRLASSTTYEVPTYIPGLPLFQLVDCVRFLKKKLRDNGFKVKLLGMSTLYISWKHIPLDDEDDSETLSHHNNSSRYSQRSTIHPSSNLHPSSNVHNNAYLSQFTYDRDNIEQNNNNGKDKNGDDFLYRDIQDELIRADAILFNMK